VKSKVVLHNTGKDTGDVKAPRDHTKVDGINIVDGDEKDAADTLAASSSSSSCTVYTSATSSVKSSKKDTGATAIDPSPSSSLSSSSKRQFSRQYLSAYKAIHGEEPEATNWSRDFKE
jgi:hypothetical protein